jgi:hypothetical protein
VGPHHQAPPLKINGPLVLWLESSGMYF